MPRQKQRRPDPGRLRLRFKTARRRIAFKVSHHRLPVGMPLGPNGTPRTPDKDLDLDVDRDDPPTRSKGKRR